jgi:hypothetical protein
VRNTGTPIRGNRRIEVQNNELHLLDGWAPILGLQLEGKYSTSVQQDQISHAGANA